MNRELTDQHQIQYDRIEKAIRFIRQNYRHQPSLVEIASHLHLSPWHLQRLFSEWAGISPKKFLQFITVEHAKKILCEEKGTLFDAAMETGLSSTGRLHDLFVRIEGMTPGEFRNGGEGLTIRYRFADTLFGRVIIASTGKGICRLEFVEDEDKAEERIRRRFPKATYENKPDGLQERALALFNPDMNPADPQEPVRLHLKGTEFQIKVWESLLRIPPGRLSTYRQVARQVGRPNASRAVGSAIGSNPVAWLIPCHRVIRSTGVVGGYHWGTSRKIAMIGWEAARGVGEQSPEDHEIIEEERTTGAGKP